MWLIFIYNMIITTAITLHQKLKKNYVKKLTNKFVMDFNLFFGLNNTTLPSFARPGVDDGGCGENFGHAKNDKDPRKTGINKEKSLKERFLFNLSSKILQLRCELNFKCCHNFDTIFDTSFLQM